MSGKFITVGWGKKETQFHGSEGKQAAHKKAAVRIHHPLLIRFTLDIRVVCIMSQCFARTLS